MILVNAIDPSPTSDAQLCPELQNIPSLSSELRIELKVGREDRKSRCLMNCAASTFKTRQPRPPFIRKSLMKSRFETEDGFSNVTLKKLL